MNANLLTKRPESSFYEELYVLTAKEFGYEKLSRIRTYHPEKRWNDLFRFWKNHYKICGRNGILFPAVHKLYWGVYPNGKYTPTQKAIIKLVEKEAKKSKNIDHAFIHNISFAKEYTFLDRHMESFSYAKYEVNSLRHEEYLMYNFWATVPGFSYASQEECKSKRDIYKDTIISIIPEAKNWPAHFWRSEYKITEALNKNYGLNLNHNERHFGMHYDSILRIVKHLNAGDLKQVCNEFYEIEYFSYKLAKALWNKDTDKILTWIYLKNLAYAKQCGKNSIVDNHFKTSWINLNIYEIIKNSALNPQLKHSINKCALNYNLEF